LALLLANLWINPLWSFVLLGAGLLYALNIGWSLHLAEAPPVIWKTLYGLPLFAWNQVRSLLRLGSARRDFLVTEKRRAMRLHEIDGEQGAEAPVVQRAEQEADQRSLSSGEDSQEGN
jgi:hypothetical protein